MRNWLFKFPRLIGLVKRIWKNKWLTNNPIFKLLILRMAKRRDSLCHATLPKISIETTCHCNAKCIMCGHCVLSMKGTMNPQLFNEIIDQVVKMGVKEVCLSIYGEPFLDPLWMERVRYTRARHLTYSFFSNGSLMRKATIDEMVALGGLRHVNFSVNGYSKEVYEKIMVNLHRDSVYNNIEIFLDSMPPLAAEKPRIDISLVRNKYNHHEIPDFIKYWKSRKGVNSVIIADLGNWLSLPNLNVNDIAVSRFSRNIPSESWLVPCPALWESMFIYYDGRIAPCCEDAAERKLIVGDAKTESLISVWNNQAFKSLRKLHKNNLRRSHPICGRCRWNPAWF